MGLGEKIAKTTRYWFCLFSSNDCRYQEIMVSQSFRKLLLVRVLWVKNKQRNFYRHVLQSRSTFSFLIWAKTQTYQKQLKANTKVVHLRCSYDGKIIHVHEKINSIHMLQKKKNCCANFLDTNYYTNVFLRYSIMFESKITTQYGQRYREHLLVECEISYRF